MLKRSEPRIGYASWNEVAAALAGLGVMYLLDPGLGERRRAALRDRASHLTRRAGEGLTVVARAVGDRARDAGAKARTLLERRGVVRRQRRIAPAAGLALGVAIGTGAAVYGWRRLR